MIKATVDTSVEVLGKTYNVKCPEHEVGALQHAAQFLEEQMRVLRESGHVLSSDKIIVTTALNIAHQLLVLEHKFIKQNQDTEERLTLLNAKLESALANSARREINASE